MNVVGWAADRRRERENSSFCHHVEAPSRAKNRTREEKKGARAREGIKYKYICKKKKKRKKRNGRKKKDSQIQAASM